KALQERRPAASHRRWCRTSQRRVRAAAGGAWNGVPPCPAASLPPSAPTRLRPEPPRRPPPTRQPEPRRPSAPSLFSPPCQVTQPPSATTARAAVRASGAGLEHPSLGCIGRLPRSGLVQLVILSLPGPDEALAASSRGTPCGTPG